jgi:Domain of unknown function (DUF4124)
LRILALAFATLFSAHLREYFDGRGVGVRHNAGMILRLCIALVLASAVGAAAAQTTYRCKDARGKISYSDHGCPGQAVSELQSRDKLESDCGQGSKTACAELRDAKKRSGSARAGKTNVKKSQRKRSSG